MSLDKLFEPIRVGRVEFRNRIVMPAMSTNFSNTDGSVSQRQIKYYSERAKGGVGLIITEAICVESRFGKLSPTQLCIDHDKYLAGLNELVEEVKRHGARIAAQLHHAGRRAQWINGERPLAPSDHLPSPAGITPKTLSKEEISFLINCFAEGARRAKAAGFDAVEVHGAHGYLIAQFLSPYTNRRTDEYGGDLKGRSKFAIEVVRRIKEIVGSDYPVIFRISADEFIEGGLTLNETKVISAMLEDVGVDILHVSAGAYETRHWTSAPPSIPPGHLVPLAAEIKKTVEIPVITVGRITDPELANKIIAEGKADFVAMGRALIADPFMPKKAMEGKLNEIRKCIGCNRCLTRFGDMLHVKCSINPTVGREAEAKIVPTNNPKKVIVIGGGPAGLEAAYIASLRGHGVTLFEKKDKLGGQLLIASVPPYKETLKVFMEYLISKVKEAGVKIKTGVEVTPETVEKETPDVVIVATGASPIIPKIAGVNLPSVVTAWDVLLGKAKVGDSVVVIGGGMVGCETAEFLADTGKSVTIVEMLEKIAIDVDFRTRVFLLQRLENKRVRMLVKTKVEEITPKGIVASQDGKKTTIPGDTFVLAVGAKPERQLYETLKRTFKDIHIIGDCVNPRKILEAIEEGFLVGLHI